MDTAISTCAFLLLAYEWDSKFLVALAFIIAITGACTNLNVKFKSRFAKMIHTLTLTDEFKDDRKARFSSPDSYKAMYWMADSDWTAGYFTNLDDAINAVKNNELDVFEHCYNYAVIEAFDEGFYPIPEMKQIWFRYDNKTDSAHGIEPPVYNEIYKYAV